MYFTIFGVPRQQQRHRPAKWGGMYDPSAKDKKAFASKLTEFKPKEPIATPLMVRLVFYMPRPKKHFRTGKYSKVLKNNAPMLHSVKPDADNLAKLVLDVLENAGFYKNDSQICQLQIEKLYIDVEEEPRTEIHIEQV